MTKSLRFHFSDFSKFSPFAVNVIWIFVCLMSCTVLAGYIFDVPTLRSISPNWIAMRPITASCFLLSGLCICLLRQESPFAQRIAKIFAFLVLLLGALSASQYIFDINIGIDTLLFPDMLTSAGNLAPGRMAFNTASNFIFFGIAILLLDIKIKRYVPSQFFALCIAIISLPALIGYVFGTNFREGLAYFTQMAFHTSLTFIPLSLSLFFLRPEYGFMEPIGSPGYGGVMSRRLLPAMVGLPFIAGWFALSGVEAGFYDLRYGITLSVIGSMCTAGFLIVQNAMALNQMDAAREKANRATLAKTEFLANMSHEIRTPINGVIGMSGLLSETKLDKVQAEYVEIIKSSAETLLMIINDILDVSKVEAGMLTLEHIDFSITSVVSKVAQTMKFAADKKDIDLKIMLDPSLPRYVKGDPTRVQQILLNLVGNAIKFTQIGHVQISVKPLSTDAQKCTIRFEVEDTGSGIPKSSIGKMFKAFSQADETVTRNFGGTGLGLSISKHLTHLMRGHIGVESIEGQGSIFWFELPFEIGMSPVEVQTAEKTELDLSNIKILVAEDNMVNQVITAQTLKKFGAHVEFAIDGAEAVKKAKEGDYNIILMDCLMPQMDGYEATRQIKTFSNTPIIALTASALLSDQKKCENAGMNDFMMKPINLTELKRVLNKWIPKK